MFAFQRWSSALEMKRYLCRYVHHIDGLPDFSALRFTKYNQYESMILPLVKYLESHGVKIEYGMDVKNVVITHEGDKMVAKQIVYVKDGRNPDHRPDRGRSRIHHQRLLHRHLLLRRSDPRARSVPALKNGKGESWDMWKDDCGAGRRTANIGNPEAFCCGCGCDELDERHRRDLR